MDLELRLEELFPETSWLVLVAWVFLDTNHRITPRRLGRSFSTTGLAHGTPKANVCSSISKIHLTQPLFYLFPSSFVCVSLNLSLMF